MASAEEVESACAVVQAAAEACTAAAKQRARGTPAARALADGAVPSIPGAQQVKQLAEALKTDAAKGEPHTRNARAPRGIPACAMSSQHPTEMTGMPQAGC